MSLAVDELYFNRHANRQLGVGVFVCVVALFSLALTGKGGTFFCGLIFIVLGVIGRTTPVIAFGDEHMEVRAAALRAKTLVRFADIVSSDDQGKNVVLATSNGQVVVPLQLIAEDERALVRERLARALPALSDPSRMI